MRESKGWRELLEAAARRLEELRRQAEEVEVARVESGKRRRWKAEFAGGPLDGGVEWGSGEAPAVLTHRVEGREGAVAVHRYRRGLEVGGIGGLVMWVFVHEGSVTA